MQMNDPWVIGGDFNSVLTMEDTGGSSVMSCDSARFGECMLNNRLKDLGFIGQPFTWQRGNIHHLLDRFLANLD